MSVFRLIFRESIPDGDGHHTGYRYKTVLVELPTEVVDKERLRWSEVIGGEFIGEKES
jgi:hypothetical protein